VPSWLAAIFQDNPELKSPYFLDQKDELKMTPFHWAVEGGNEEVVELLLVHGADVNVEDYTGFTPLQRSFENGDEIVAQQLLDQDAVFTIHRFGPNPFYQAARWGNKRMLSMLLERGPDINEFDSDGIAALHQAVLNGESTSVQLLLDLGANSNAMSNDPCNKIAPLHLVPDIHGERIVKLFLNRGANLEAQDYSGRTPLYVSCQSGFVENVLLLIEMGADIWVKNYSGGTLLHAAVESGSEAMVRLFLREGFDVKAKNDAGQTLLHQIATSIFPTDRIAILNLLISLGVDVNEKDFEDSTALHVGATSYDSEIVQYLIEHGADLGARDTLGRTSLHHAIHARNRNFIKTHHTETIRALVRGGVDVSVRDNDGNTPLDCADPLDREELEQLVMDSMPK
jgi:ankyrin repeat protein